MKKFRIFGRRDQAVTPLEKKNRALAREAAAKGIVLLKNDGVLPLSTDTKIDLFGTGARMTVFGGSGSGDTKGREKVTVEAGLRNAGFSLGKTDWLDRFDKKYESARKSWKAEVEEAIRGYSLFTVQQMYEEIWKHPFPFPVGDPITESDTTEGVDTAVFVLARQAGEGGDRQVAAGDYLLSDGEKDSLRFLRKAYKNLILIINAGASLDLDILDVLDVDALLFMGQPGEEAGNALADILSGAMTPSAHLTSTWAKQYADYPCADSYAKNSPADEEADYREGVLVGYRWFDMNNINPRFPFGFGLSYTTFETKVMGMKQEGNDILLSCEVKNTGAFPGQHLIQIYLKKPVGEIQQVKKELAAFEKTPELFPGEEKTIEVRLPLETLRSYVEEDNAWHLLPGAYTLYLGENACSVSRFGAVLVEKDFLWEKLSALKGTDRFTDIAFETKREEGTGGLSLVIDTNRINPEKGGAWFPEEAEARAVALSKTMEKKDLASLLVGANVTGAGFNRAPGAVGKTTNSLLKKYELPNINMADGPAGLNLLPENMITKGGMELAYQHLPEDRTWGFLKNLEWMAVGKEGRDIPVFQYTTAFPSTTVRAQSFDRDLDYRIGQAVGEEMKAFGITLWLAPAVNIQRNPLCGRNFEYASEDPLVAGEMAAAIIRGVQSVGGVGATIKHFCANNQETERTEVSSNISVRALREIYLRPFEIAVKKAKPWAVMSSYNRLNGTFTGNHTEILTGVLRTDFGFGGVVITDWRGITEGRGEYVKCAPSGNDLIMPGVPAEKKILRKALQDGTLAEDDARRSAERILKIVFASNVWEV